MDSNTYTPPALKPCPSCGHCPTCGQKATRHPWEIPMPYQPQPYPGNNDWPRYQWGGVPNPNHSVTFGYIHQGPTVR